MEVIVAGDVGHVQLDVILFQQGWSPEESGQPKCQSKRTPDGYPMALPAVD